MRARAPPLARRSPRTASASPAASFCSGSPRYAASTTSARDPARAHERPRTSSGARGPGSLIDIVPLARQVQHSWHQDVGVPGLTVLLGFPPRDRYVGGGVFSSHVKLSHPLRPTHGEAHGAVVEYERFEPPPPRLPTSTCCARSTAAAARSVSDSCHLHSTPDRQCREGLWRSVSL